MKEINMKCKLNSSDVTISRGYGGLLFVGYFCLTWKDAKILAQAINRELLEIRRKNRIKTLRKQKKEFEEI